MSVAEKIKYLLKVNDRSLSWLAKHIGMSRPGFNSMLENDSIKVSTLKKIAEIFKVPIDYFFTEKVDELKDKLGVSYELIKQMSTASAFYSIMALGVWGKMTKLIENGQPISVDELKSIRDVIDHSMTKLDKYLTKDFTEEEKAAFVSYEEDLKQKILSGNMSEKDIENWASPIFRDISPE